MKRFIVVLAVVFVAVLAGCRLTPQPSAAASSAAVYTFAPDVTTPAQPSGQELLDAFKEIAFTSEYGNSSSEIRKWTGPVKVAVHGSPTGEDLAALKRAMDGLNALPGFPGISQVEAGQNMDIWFVPLGKMADAVPGYVAGNWGYFTSDFTAGKISASTVAIATDVTKQNERNHLIFEEVLQSTGLMQDSNRYVDSIFYGPWTTVQQPTPMDWKLLEMLYMPELKPGMGLNKAMGVLAGKVVSPT